MDFNDTPEEAAFRKQAREFLTANAKSKAEAGRGMAVGWNKDEALAAARAWQATKADGGFAGITWPEEYGGQGLSPIMQVIYNQEEADFVVPRGVYEIGLGMCIPTMFAYASEEQKKRYAPKALRGEEIWCQLFSEPAGGSDLAGLRTRAERDGDDWVINGQKIWTSGAQFSDYAILVTRSDFEVAKHKGLTFFFLSMHSPGIEVRPIRQVNGAANFNEVFFTDVRIPDSQRLGAVGEGWKVSLTTLMNERFAVGVAPPPDFDEIFDLVRDLELEDGPALDNAVVRDRLADWYVRQQGLKNAHFRTMTALSRGETPGPESSINKVVSASKYQDISIFGMDVLEMAGAIVDPEIAPMDGLFATGTLSSPGYRIAGGTDEILRNIIAERVLGLPQDVRVDKELAFRDLPTGRD
ncbi:MAG: acyl-CoA dehydrogenase family protein [Alphaproteobacteria bacterium]|jgi:alkylation response protein AidB-like acyl-CoA dehydrogenase|nr:acyl-CoA dehydrogenase family protein [Alphaproteobacteria bacterium]MDP6563193.1 acyl-CoA dehydrogenase family protein [Alphaproteobacteria bacterium]MDP6816019.1 acyl-CoA dehydrogenase family protein [Alphaproteobacteria bacterium]